MSGWVSSATPCFADEGSTLNPRIMKIAILMTCHNRRETTLRCLRGLPSDVEVYLVDDGSTDGTDEAVKATFPKVNVIRGTGNLYWAKGMELAWKTCLQHEVEKVGGGGQRSGNSAA